jgi:DNA-binding CsgD family transcriptional regulator
VLARIGDAAGSASVWLVTTENFTRPVDVWLARFDPACIDVRFQHYARPETNPGVRSSMRSPPLHIIQRKQFATDRQFERDPCARSILLSQGLYHGCISTLHRDNPLLSTIAIYRPRHLGDFDGEEIQLLQRLVPHLARALHVGRHMRASQPHQWQTEEALNLLNFAILLLAGDGRIVFTNRAAADLLRRGDGITSRGGKLAATEHTSNARLVTVVLQVANQAAQPRTAQALHLDRGPARRPLQVWAVPLPHDSHSRLISTWRSDVMLLITDPAITLAPPIDVLRALYELTDAEAHLAAALLEDVRLDQYAGRAGISMNTARTHLKSIFAKTDTNRQAQLVHLLSRTLYRPE